jgi:type II secretory pathway component PulF
MSSYEESVKERILTVLLTAAMLITIGFFIGGVYFSMMSNLPERAGEPTEERRE